MIRSSYRCTAQAVNAGAVRKVCSPRNEGEGRRRWRFEVREREHARTQERERQREFTGDVPKRTIEVEASRKKEGVQPVQETPKFHSFSWFAEERTNGRGKSHRVVLIDEGAETSGSKPETQDV